MDPKPEIKLSKTHSATLMNFMSFTPSTFLNVLIALLSVNFYSLLYLQHVFIEPVTSMCCPLQIHSIKGCELAQFIPHY